MKHYVYRHIRLDKNEPFYIGIGTMYKRCKAFTRANEKKSKNPIWKAIVNKTDYKVEIILQTDDYELVKQKEIELIKFYGRIDLKTGHLSNMTDGGEGVMGLKNHKVAEMNKLRKGENSPNWGRKRDDVALRVGDKHPMFGKTGKLHPKSKIFTDISNNNIYYGVKEAAAGIGIPEVTLNSYVYKGRKNKTNLRW